MKEWYSWINTIFEVEDWIKFLVSRVVDVKSYQELQSLKEVKQIREDARTYAQRGGTPVRSAVIPGRTPPGSVRSDNGNITHNEKGHNNF